MQQQQKCGPCNKQQLKPKQRQQIQLRLLEQLLTLCDDPDEATPKCGGRKQGQNVKGMKNQGGCKRKACGKECSCDDSVKLRAITDILSSNLPKSQSVNIMNMAPTRQLAAKRDAVAKIPRPSAQIHDVTQTELLDVLSPDVPRLLRQAGPPRSNDTHFSKEYIFKFPQHEAEKAMCQRAIINETTRAARDALAKACVRVGKMEEVSEADQQYLLDELRSRLFTLNQQYAQLPVAEDTEGRRSRRNKLEQQLDKLERYIELLEKTWPLYVSPE